MVKYSDEKEKIKTLTVEIEEIVEEPQINKINDESTETLKESVDEHRNAGKHSPNHSDLMRERTAFGKKILAHKSFKKILVLTIVVMLFVAAEIGFLVFRKSVKEAPQNINEMKKEIQELRDENKKIKDELSQNGSYKIKEETRDSWAKLKKRVESEK